MQSSVISGYAIRSASMLATSIVFALLATGCREMPRTSNVDSAFLTAPLTLLSDGDKETNLLPLAPGNSWQMRSVTRGRRYQDTVTVAGPINENGVACVALDLSRDGKPWRREVYVPNANAVILAAAQDESMPIMSYNPPITLASAPFVEGQSWNWDGMVQLKSKNFPARGFSRVSGRETITTAAGQFKVYRIDTIIVMNDEGHEYRFPSVRWLAPDVGFVRRGFADKGQPAFSELLQFNVH